jgi:acetyl esterase
MVDPSRSCASQQDFAEGYMLTASYLEWGWRSYRGARRSVANDALYDVRKADWRGFPATTLVTAGCDPLRDEGEDLWCALREAGTPALLRRYERMIHGFAGLPHVTDAAADALSFVGGRLAEAFEIEPAGAGAG